MSKFDEPFKILTYNERLPWNAKSPLVPVIPIGTNPYYGAPGDFYDYDGYIDRDDNGMYHYADVGQEFFAEVEPASFEGGRSAANVRLSDVNRPGVSYMFSAYDYIKELTVSNLPYGKIRGKWKFAKRGANYRVTLINHTS